MDRLNERLKEHPAIAWGLLALVAALVYGRALGGAFVSDDDQVILQNPFVLNPHLWRHIFTSSVWSFQGVSFHGGYYRPLQFFTYWLIYRLSGPNPGAYHLVSLLLYIASGGMVYGLGCELISAARAELRGLAGALFWLLHPLHVEPVAWVAGLTEVGFGFFYLWSFRLFLRAERGGKSPWRLHGLAAFLFFVALLFKEMALSLLLLLITWWVMFPEGKGASKWLGRAARWTPYLAAAGIYLAIHSSATGAVFYWPRLWAHLPAALVAALGLLGEHTRLFFWPSHASAGLAFDLGASLRSLWPWAAVMVLAGALLFRKAQPVLVFLLMWWPVALAPVLDIRQLTAPVLADRFSYLPSAGPCLALGFLTAAWLPGQWKRPQAEWLIELGLASTLVVWGVLSFRAIAKWRDNDTLLRAWIRQAPDSASLHLLRGRMLQSRPGDSTAAAKEFETALSLNEAGPRPLPAISYEAYLDLGKLAAANGRPEEASRWFERAARLYPGLSPAYDSLASLYFPRGDYEAAAEYYSKAAEVDPQDEVARFALATCWMKLGKFREAAEQFHAAREIDPSYSQAYAAEAKALIAAGDPAAAARVVRLMPPP